ncbi:uncharacterized protein LOC119397642 [Rhipicephalus sanguineus]|uniref:uncharacterized protein LOC119397642 n=1 Tax=Rhipicephalus sanguineus TaxID=34632 RepID=UPI0020C5205D|nr:uncharacterized protein LOC119397642 [Rhipicephalus sanguineus]
MDVLTVRILLPILITDIIWATPAVLASTPIVPSTLPPFATASVKSRNNGTPMGASRPQEGATYFNATSPSDANATSIPEESERVLNHLMRLMETLNHVPYLEALSRGSLHDKDKIPVIKEAVKELKVGVHDNATLSVTLYESPQEGGEALPTMQKEFIFVHPPANASQDLAPEAGNLHGHISPHAPHRGVCWSYEPRGNKPVLPFASAHSKLVKCAVIQSCFHNSLSKSCEHKIEESLWGQAKRLCDSGYPMRLLSAVAERLNKKYRSNPSEHQSDTRRKKLAVVPYIHTRKRESFLARSVGGHERQGYRYGQWAVGGRSQKHEQHGRQSAGGAHRHLEDAHGKVHKERGHDKGGQAERKYRVRTEIEYFEREKFKDDEHDKLKAAHRSKASTDAIKGADRFASQGHQSHQRHLGGGYAQGTQHAVGVGYAPVYVHGAPVAGGNKGIDGGRRDFSQKDAQNHEEYHHEAGSQGFTDKDKGHQRAGWRERGYRIIAEKEYVDKDKHHDKAYGVDNQERGHRLRSQGQHAHKQGQDDIKKAKEHYGHGVHDSAHHEKAHKNRAAYGKTYHGSTVHLAGPRDHLSSSTDKVAELEAGNTTNTPDDTPRRKKVIRIRVLSKTPGIASVTIGGRATNVPPETGPHHDAEEPTEHASPPKDISQVDNFGRSYESLAGGSAADSTRTPKKHFVPMEVLASLYTNVRGDPFVAIPREQQNLNNQPYSAQIHRPVVHSQGPAVNSRELYNEKSFQPLIVNPGLREENRENRNPNYGTQTYGPPSTVDTAGPALHHSPGVETGGRTHYGQQGYIPGPPPRLTSLSRGNHQAQANVATSEGSGGHPDFKPNSEIGVDAVPPYTATSADQDSNNVRFYNTQVNNGQGQSNAYGNPGALSVNQVPGALHVLSQTQNAPNDGYYTGNAPAPLAQQQQSPVPVAMTHALRYPGQVTSRPDIPYANPYNVDAGVVIPSQDAGTVPAVHVSTYPVYVEGTAVQPDTYRLPIEKPGVQGGYSPHVLTGVSGYQGADNPTVGHYVQVYPGVQEASQIVPVGQEKDRKSKLFFKTFDDKDINGSPTLQSSEDNEKDNNRQTDDDGTKNANESYDDGRLSTCQEENCTLPIEKSRLNQLALSKATAVFRDFDKIKKPFRDCQTGACGQGRKCSRKELASGMCSLKKDNSVTSPVNGFRKIQKESMDFGRSKGRSDEELSSEATEKSGERTEGQNDDQLKPSTMEEQAIMTADAQLKAARPTLEGMGYILNLGKPARKPLRPDKIIKIVKKDYFSQPLRLSSGGNVKHDGLWHAKTSAS